MTVARYDAIAGWYDEFVRGAGAWFHELAIGALLDLAGEIAGLEVCDLACGEGVLARALARRGAAVTGIDISRPLLDLARRKEAEESLGVRYQLDDAQTLATIPDARFDGMACAFSLVDIDDLRATLTAVCRALKPGGWFVFAIPHPCVITRVSHWAAPPDAPGRVVSGYFDEGQFVIAKAPGVRGKVGVYHRTLATYLNALNEAGLALERIAEPRATGGMAERIPGATEAPAILAARCVKHSASASGA
jgi:2-polyprenyl-3-methyl-5-hydroxy-6-metoxy-1,4-benzoquinol methylase